MDAGKARASKRERARKRQGRKRKRWKLNSFAATRQTRLQGSETLFSFSLSPSLLLTTPVTCTRGTNRGDEYTLGLGLVFCV